jgi:hypothetical protein
MMGYWQQAAGFGDQRLNWLTAAVSGCCSLPAAVVIACCCCHCLLQLPRGAAAVAAFNAAMMGYWEPASGLVING